mmetsp:Transcript_21520/g.33177  ORF Transcript_21520/g.33177 Transcript_21520/m.33177 type:complete len:103 (+) Transcript_21520:875-1183(+)
MGLADPDGSKFHEEIASNSIPNIESSSVTSYKYLQSQFSEIRHRSVQRRQFMKDMSKKQLNPHLKRSIFESNKYNTPLQGLPVGSAFNNTIDVGNMLPNLGG